MASSRYWRAIGLQAYGYADLELSELQLYSGTSRVDAAATLSSSHAPATGSLAALADDDTTTACAFSGADVRSAGFFLLWTFPSVVDVSGVRPGAALEKYKYLERLELQYRDAAGVWVTAFGLGRFVWPGVQSLDVPPAGGDAYFSDVAVLLPMTGASGSTTFTDVKGGIWTPAGGAAISTAHSFFGTGVGVFGGGARITLPHASAPDLTNSGFSIEFLVRLTATGVYHVLVNKGFATGNFAYQVWIDNTNKFGFRGAVSSGGSVDLNILGGVATIGVDYFFSARRVGDVFTLHVNDILIGSQTIAGPRYSDAAPISIGAYENGAAGLQGYMGQLRITSGVERPTNVPFAPWPTSSGAGQVFESLALRPSRSRARVAASAAVSLHSAARTGGLQMARDTEFGGPGTIYGTTKTKGTPNTPTKARVVLLHQRSKQPVRETWSDPVTGAFAFTGIDTTQQFLTLAEDAAGNFRPVAASRLVPEVLP